MAPSKSTSVQGFLAGGVAERVRRVLQALADVRAEPNTRNTHFLSTSIRRLLVVDSILDDLYDRSLLEGREAELRSLRKVLGTVRDMQEIRLKFLGLELHSPAARAFDETLARREAEAEARIGQAVARFDPSFLDALATKKACRELCRGRAAMSPKKLARRRLKKVLRLKVRAVDEEDDAALHKMRVRYKRFRYTVELFAPDFIEAGSRRLKYLKSLQEAMGQAHDWMVLEEEVRAFFRTRRLSGKRAALATIADLRAESHRDARGYVAAELPKLAKQHALHT